MRSSLGKIFNRKSLLILVFITLFFGQFFVGSGCWAACSSGQTEYMGKCYTQEQLQTALTVAQAQGMGISGMESYLNFQTNVLRYPALIAAPVASSFNSLLNSLFPDAAISSSTLFTKDGKTQTDNSPALTPTEKMIANLLGIIFYYLAAGLSWIVSVMVGVMLYVMTFPLNITTLPIVVKGWAIVRDLCNNFFIVILLVIAVGTILKIQTYHYKALLPRLLTMAVVINFSLMFTGILIDASQILMLSFTQGFNGAMGNNVILNAIGLPDLFSMNGSAGSGVVTNLGNQLSEEGATSSIILNIITAMIFAIIVSVVALVCISMVTVVLVYRMIMLMFLAILSPLPYFLSTFPQGKSKAGEWWNEFNKYLIVGPVMVFFLWISFSAMAGDSPGGEVKNAGAGERGTVATTFGAGNAAKNVKQNADGTEPLTSSGSETINNLTKMLSVNGIVNFMLVCGLMIGSLYMAQKSGVAGASWAGKGMGALKKMPSALGAAIDDKVGARAGLTKAAYSMGGKKVPFLGTYLAQKSNQFADASKKREEAKFKAAADLRGRNFSNMSDEDLRRGMNGKLATKQERMTYFKELSGRKGLKDGDLATVNSIRGSMPSSLTESFDEVLQKANPALAFKSSLYNGAATKEDKERLERDIGSGKIDLAKMMGKLSGDDLEKFKANLGGNDDALAKFLLANGVDDLSKIKKGMTEDNATKVFGGVDHNTFKKDDGTIDEKKREAYLDAGFDFTKAFDQTDDTQLEAARKWVSANKKKALEGLDSNSFNGDFIENYVGTGVLSDKDLKDHFAGKDLVNEKRLGEVAVAKQAELENRYATVDNSMVDGEEKSKAKAALDRILKASIVNSGSLEGLGSSDEMKQHIGRIVSKMDVDALSAIKASKLGSHGDTLADNVSDSVYANMGRLNKNADLGNAIRENIDGRLAAAGGIVNADSGIEKNFNDLINSLKGLNNQISQMDKTMAELEREEEAAAAAGLQNEERMARAKIDLILEERRELGKNRVAKEKDLNTMASSNPSKIIINSTDPTKSKWNQSSEQDDLRRLQARKKKLEGKKGRVVVEDDDEVV